MLMIQHDKIKVHAFKKDITSIGAFLTYFIAPPASPNIHLEIGVY